jgi:hypothetical protein
VQLEPAIVAPGPAIEADDDRALGNEGGTIDEIALAIGHGEIGQHLADGRHVLIGLFARNALHESIIGRLKLGQELARLAEIKFQALLERPLEGIRLFKGLL